MGPNELLLWLSARREGSWGQFRSAVEEILSGNETDTGDESITSYQKMRFALEQLGHVEFEGKGGQRGWQVAPPVLAATQQPEGFVGVVCGARSSSLLARLRDLSGLRSDISESEFHPCVIRLSTNDIGRLSVAAGNVGLGFQPDTSIRILSCAGRVERLPGARAAQLPFGRDFEVLRFVIGHWGCKWVASTDAEAAQADGLYRFVRFQIPEHYLKRRGRVLKVDGQTAKFFLLAERRKQVLRYDRRSRTLTTPGICRPPLLIDRALALCTGFPAGYERKTRTLVYAGISEDVAGSAASLLLQNGI